MDPSDPFKVEEIQAVWVVPVARVPFYTCTGTTYESSQWVGIDGADIDGGTSTDLLQVGTEADAACGGYTSYYFWFEWLPNPSIQIGYPLTASAGDLVYVAVWNSSPTLGHAYIMDISTTQVFSFSFSAPSGTTLKGDSVEWIVERPEVGGAFTELTNYLDVWMWGDYAWNYTSSSPTYYYPGYNPTGTAYQIQMLDDSSNGESSGNLVTPATLLFQNYGSSEQW